jgi:hypothetical protein
MRLRNWNLILTAALGVASAASAGLLALKTLSYRPTYRQPQGTLPPAPALVSRLVLVMIDGLPYPLARDMSCMQQVAKRGASATSITVLPSMSQPAWTALVTGARPEISGAALFNAEFAAIQPIPVDHLFLLAKQAGLTTALAGQEWWRRMIPAQFVDRAHYVAGFDAAGDQEATLAAVEFLGDPTVNLLMLYLGEYDEASDVHAATSQAAQEALQRTNERLCTLLERVDWSNTVVAVAADHGQLPQGGHGGDDKSVLETLFVLSGPHVRPGEYHTIQQPDIAVTLAALLGLPLPRSGQGRILYELLETSPAEKARGQAALVVQTMAQADAYLWSIKAPTLPTALHDQASKLSTLLQAERIEEADRLSSTLLDQTALYVTRERAAKINSSRLARVPLALVGLALILVTFVANWRSRYTAALLLALLGVAAYQAFWIARGHVYSLSTLGSAGSPMNLVVTLVGGALGILALGLLLLWLLSLLRRDSKALLFSSAAVSTFCVGIVGILFSVGLIAFTANGSLGSWQIVVPRLAFLALLAWLQATLIGLVSLLGFGLVRLVRCLYFRKR